MTDRLLIIFVKNPQLGKVKTRLAATMGDQQALDIYLKLLEYTVAITRELAVEKVVYYSEFIDQQDHWPSDIYLKQLQVAGDLGIKMKAAFEWGFQSGYKEICIIGSDCLELTPEIIMSGFQALDSHDAVLGPTIDGGYYLMGLKQLHHTLFVDKEWGTHTVGAATRDDLNELNLSYSLLETLTDVDHEEDLDGHDLGV